MHARPSGAHHGSGASDHARRLWAHKRSPRCPRLVFAPVSSELRQLRSFLAVADGLEPVTFTLARRSTTSAPLVAPFAAVARQVTAELIGLIAGARLPPQRRTG